MNQTSTSKQTLHTSPWLASYEVSVYNGTALYLFAEVIDKLTQTTLPPCVGAIYRSVLRDFTNSHKNAPSNKFTFNVFQCITYVTQYTMPEISTVQKIESYP